MSAKAYAFSPHLMGRLLVAELAEGPKVDSRLVLIFRVIVGLVVGITDEIIVNIVVLTFDLVIFVSGNSHHVCLILSCFYKAINLLFSPSQ